MLICIFCPATLDQTTKPEHILQNALGGKKTTRHAICSECNNTFGGGIDKVLAEQFAHLRNMLQLKSGTGSFPPPIKKVNSGSNKIDLLADGTIKLANKPFEIVHLPHGQKQLRVNGQSLEHIGSMIPHMAAALKVSEDRLRELIGQTEMSVVRQRPDPIHVPLQFGGPDAMRSVMKSCLVLWTTLVGNSELQNPRYDAARQFVKNGNSEFLEACTFLDERTHQSACDIIKKYGPVFSLIYVRSDHEGQVFGHFTVYNLIGFSVILAPDGAPPNQRIALINNPITGAWSVLAADEFDVSVDWLSKPEFDYSGEQLKARLAPVMEYYIESSREREIQRIIVSVLSEHGLKEGDIIPPHMALSISESAATRITHHLFGRKHERELSGAEIQEAIGSKLKETE